MDHIRRIAEGILLSLAKSAKLQVGVFVTLPGKPYETKNIISGHGGALLVNDERFLERAEIIREKGTNRSQFFRGLVDKYTWVDIGSSFLPGEVTAAFLWAQMEQAEAITAERIALWSRYHGALERGEAAGAARRPIVPSECKHNAHMYHILLSSPEDRTALVAALAARGLHAVFHYVPLHSSAGGRRFAAYQTECPTTEQISGRLLRLPFHNRLGDGDVDRVVEPLLDALA